MSVEHLQTALESGHPYFSCIADEGSDLPKGGTAPTALAAQQGRPQEEGSCSLSVECVEDGRRTPSFALGTLLTPVLLWRMPFPVCRGGFWGADTEEGHALWPRAVTTQQGIAPPPPWEMSFSLFLSALFPVTQLQMKTRLRIWNLSGCLMNPDYRGIPEWT